MSSEQTDTPMEQDTASFYKLLDLPEEAGLNEVKSAYQVLQALEPDNKQIENAYDTLKTITTGSEPMPFISGLFLKKIRTKLEIELEDITATTKIMEYALTAIENEDYEALPPEVFLKGFLGNYAKCLNLDPKFITSGYLNKLAYVKTKQTPEHKKGFGFKKKS